MKTVRFYRNPIIILVFALYGITIFYILISDKPFAFLASPVLNISLDRISGSVVNILCEDTSNDKLVGGSGTVIDAEGVIITNSHIFPQDETTLHITDKGCLIAFPETEEGQMDEIYWGKPIVIPDLSDKYDLAYITIYDVFVNDEGKKIGTYPKKFPSLYDDEGEYQRICLLNSDVDLGDSIKVYGYPETSGGYNLTITEGIVSSIDENGFIYTSAKTDKGNSGGLVVNDRGCMIGIPLAVKEGAYQNFGVIIPMDLVNEFSEQFLRLDSE